jgi:hypothetical protein
MRKGTIPMHTEKIDVISYAGRKGDERPETFILRGLRIDILEILEHWIEEGFRDRVRKRYFRVKGSDGNTHRIYYDEEVLGWYYSSKRRTGPSG